MNDRLGYGVLNKISAVQLQLTMKNDELRMGKPGGLAVVKDYFKSVFPTGFTRCEKNSIRVQGSW